MKHAEGRLQYLLQHADYLSSLLQQEAEVVLIKDDSTWHAYLRPWVDEEIQSVQVFNTLPSHFVKLEGIRTIRLNDEDLQELSLCFLPMRGIEFSYVRAKDSVGKALGAKELGLMKTGGDPSLIITLIGKDTSSLQSLDLSPFAHLTTHISIPQEYLDLDV